MKKYEDYIIIKYGNKVLFNDYTDGSGVGLVVLNQNKDYSFVFQ